MLETSVIDSESPDYDTTISLITSEDYDKDEPVYIFEISVKKDNVKVQPNGKVKVSVPIETDLTGYDVLHIKGDGKIERLSVTYKNGIATFETDSFSKFVFVKKVAPVDSGDDGGEPDKDAKGDDAADDTKTKYTFTANVQEYVGVNDVGTISENDAVVDLSTGREVADGTKITLTATAKEGYALKGWYKVVEGETDTLISCATTYEFNVNENMNIKAVFDEKVTIEITARAYMLWTSTPRGSLIFKTKGVVITENKGYSLKVDVAKGTEVTIDVMPCKGWDFTGWDYYWRSEGGSNSRLVSENKEFTFIAKSGGYFYAMGQGIPERLEFSSTALAVMKMNGGYSWKDGHLETTVTVGSTFEEWYKKSYIYVLYADDTDETNVQLYYENGYTIDVGNLDVNKVGRYEVKYVYTGYSPNGPVTMSIFINVVADTTE